MCCCALAFYESSLQAGRGLQGGKLLPALQRHPSPFDLQRHKGHLNEGAGGERIAWTATLRKVNLVYRAQALVCPSLPWRCAPLFVPTQAGRQSVSRGGQGRTGTWRASHKPARVQWRHHGQDGRANATLLHQSTLSTHPPSSSAASSCCCCCLVRPCQLGQTGTRARARESRTGTETRSEAEDPENTHL